MTEGQKRTVSDITRAKMSEEARAKISEARKGRTLSEEHRAKIAEAQRIRWAKNSTLNSEEDFFDAALLRENMDLDDEV